MSKLLHTRKGGFTLIELMIVVAIIGILAAIAIPNFLRFQLRARSSEGKTNVAAIRTAEEGYFAEYNVYVPAADAGNLAGPGNQKAVWPGTPAGFSTVGWAPEGQVYFAYNVTTGVDSLGAPAYAVGAAADIDNDMIAAQSWGYIKASTAAMAGLANVVPAVNGGVAGTPCPVGGTYNPQSMANDLLNTTGPCDGTSGQSVF